MRRAKRIAVFGIVLLVAIYVVTWLTYQISIWRLDNRLNAGSELVMTERGPIEISSLGEGPSILVLHGTPGGYDQGVMMGERFAPAGFRVLAVSRPGYLRTPGEPGQTMDEQVAVYAALLDELGIDNVAVVGGSGGGPSAFAFARRHPERVWALTHMIGLACCLPTDAAHVVSPSVAQRVLTFLFDEHFIQWVMLHATQRFPEYLLLSEGFGMVNEDSRLRIVDDEQKLANFHRMLWTGFTRNREPGRQIDIPLFIELDQSGAENIRVPSFFVHGNDDSNAPYEDARALADRIPDAEFLTIEDGDHWAFLSRPEDVIDPVVEFLTRHAPSFD